MNEYLFLKGQRVKSAQGEGEVIDSLGDKIVVKLDSGVVQTFNSNELADDSDAG